MFNVIEKDLTKFSTIRTKSFCKYYAEINSNNDVKSAIGLGLDWYSPMGPMNFSLSQHLSKGSNDITESFRFNLGTTF